MHVMVAPAQYYILSSRVSNKHVQQEYFWKWPDPAFAIAQGFINLNLPPPLFLRSPL